jgi:hypothetical protein
MAVTDEDVDAIAQRLVELARTGDVAAARLLLSYAVGRPTDAVDPDTLDQQEWAIFRQIPVPPAEVERLLHDVPVDFACELTRALAPHLSAMTAAKAKPILCGDSKSTKKQRKRAARCKTEAASLLQREGLLDSRTACR